MNQHPEEICSEIAAAMTTDAFSFYAAARAEQNVEVDELEAPIIFLDPVEFRPVPRQSGYIEKFCNLKLMFLYDEDMDKAATETLTNRKKALRAADEFINRLMRHDNIKTVEINSESSMIEVPKITDRALCGCTLDLKISIHNDQSTCTT